ncbi:hypothetical protein [Nonomuraea sp. CA-141351]|uniref:hypothetical protein n=1 Tax=Nonomuraea sp. CA-141351 TaxID=3239996 RepID=UPI003D8AEEFC
MERIDHHSGGYAYLAGGTFASGGVIALAGMGIRHVVLDRPVPLLPGLDLVRRELDHAGRPLVALCGLELRLPAAMTEPRFEEFNGRYLEHLGRWGLLRDGSPPLARTNVAPSTAPPEVASLLAFSYTAPTLSDTDDMVITGVADVGPDGAAIQPGDMVESASFVAKEVSARITALGSRWAHGDRTHLYCARPAVFEIARSVLGPQSYGLVWHDSVPPVLGLELEIDVRRHHREQTLEIT